MPCCSFGSEESRSLPTNGSLRRKTRSLDKLGMTDCRMMHVAPTVIPNGCEESRSLPTNRSQGAENKTLPTLTGARATSFARDDGLQDGGMDRIDS